MFILLEVLHSEIFRFRSFLYPESSWSDPVIHLFLFSKPSLPSLIIVSFMRSFFTHFFFSFAYLPATQLRLKVRLRGPHIWLPVTSAKLMLMVSRASPVTFPVHGNFTRKTAEEKDYAQWLTKFCAHKRTRPVIRPSSERVRHNVLRKRAVAKLIPMMQIAL